MVEIDAMGLECPQPVIKAKQAVEKTDKKEDILVRVDNEVALQNLSRLGSQLGAMVEAKKISDKEFTVLFNFSDATTCKIMDDSFQLKTSEYVVAMGSQKLGGGEEELGLKLGESFIYALTEQDVKPKIILFYN